MLAAGCRQRLARFWGECHGQRQADDEAHRESQGFRPAVVSHPHHPLSAWSKKGVANRLSATDDRREFPGIFYYTGGVDLCQCISCFSGDFPLFFACFGPENFITVPTQHRPFCDLRQEPGDTGLTPLPVACSHIHSKTACRGVSERQWRSAAPVSAPASVGAGRSPPGSSTRGSSRDQVLLPLPQNRRKHWVFAGFLFARVVWEWGSLWFRHLVFPSVRTCSQPLPPPQAPKTHPTSAIFA